MLDATLEIVNELKRMNVEYKKYCLVKDAVEFFGTSGFSELDIYKKYINQWESPVLAEIKSNRSAETDTLDNELDFCISLPPLSKENISSLILNRFKAQEEKLIAKLKQENRSEYHNYLDSGISYFELAREEVINEIDEIVKGITGFGDGTRKYKNTLHCFRAKILEVQ